MGGNNYYHFAGKGKGKSLIGKGRGKPSAKWTCRTCSFTHPASMNHCPWCDNVTSASLTSSSQHSSSAPHIPPKRKPSRWNRNKRDDWNVGSDDYDHDWSLRNRRNYLFDSNYQSFDIGTPSAPPAKESQVVIDWLQECDDIDPAVINLLKRATEAKPEPKVPIEPWKDLQSSHAKLKSISDQIGKADSRIARLEEDLHYAQELRQSLDEKEKGLRLHIESIMPGSFGTQNDHVHAGKQAIFYEQLIRAVQASLSAGLPQAGSPAQTDVYDMVFHGKLPAASVPADQAPAPTSLTSETIHSDEAAAPPSPGAAMSEAASVGAASGVADDSSLVVDKDGFGFNPAPKRAARLAQPYARARAMSLDMSDRPLFSARPAASPLCPGKDKAAA